MKADELRRMYVEFFCERGHKEVASASLLPENDPTVLFTTAGMHPFVPYLLGEKHPQGKRLVDIQKCIRTGDIDEVGDDTHLTFFEMLGNWSLGDYFKQESISMSYEFLVTKLNIPKEKLAVTVFEGDDIVPRDDESAKIWMEKGLLKSQIFYYGREENWWGPAGQTGPCGPDTEIFYDMGKEKCGPECGPSCHCGKYVEIWNNVFMQYNKQPDGSYTELTQKNVDTGMGLERILTIFNGYTNVYETELFVPVMTRLDEIIKDRKMPLREKRIICEHIRAICFVLGDDKHIVPSNTEQGYILRRLIRRIIRLLKKNDINQNILCELSGIIIEQYNDIYNELGRNKSFIFEQLDKEYQLFSKTLDIGLKKAEWYFANLKENDKLSGEIAFKLYDTFGFPIEFTTELAKEKGLLVDIEGYNKKFAEHQEKSRQGAEGKFKGGLADHSEQTAKLHTATHLLNGALRTVLGENVYQRGSNITAERLRFDFSFDRKVTKEELEEVSNEIVKVYIIPGYSKEICGGPHAKNTAELGKFTIIKEEASSAGVRRIKAVIE